MFICVQVPGNFHVSTHSATAQPQSPDMTHTIHKLAFGEKLQVGHIFYLFIFFRWRKWRRITAILTQIFSLFIVTQVQKVQGAFNALGGADKMSSNRMYLDSKCYDSAYVHHIARSIPLSAFTHT